MLRLSKGINRSGAGRLSKSVRQESAGKLDRACTGAGTHQACRHRLAKGPVTKYGFSPISWVGNEQWWVIAVSGCQPTLCGGRFASLFTLVLLGKRQYRLSASRITQTFSLPDNGHFLWLSSTLSDYAQSCHTRQESGIQRHGLF
jgi:hypothetical protein